MRTPSVKLCLETDSYVAAAEFEGKPYCADILVKNGGTP